MTSLTLLVLLVLIGLGAWLVADDAPPADHEPTDAEDWWL